MLIWICLDIPLKKGVSYHRRLCLPQHGCENVRSPKQNGDSRLFQKIDSCRYMPDCMAPFPQVKKFLVFTLKISNISDFYIPLFGPFFPSVIFPPSFRLCSFFFFFFFFNSACSSFLLLLLPLFFFLSFLHPFTPVINSSSAPHKLTFNCHVLCAFSVQTFQSPLVLHCRFVSSAVQQTLQGRFLCQHNRNFAASSSRTPILLGSLLGFFNGRKKFRTII